MKEACSSRAPSGGAGFELRVAHVRFGAPGRETAHGAQALTREAGPPPAQALRKAIVLGEAGGLWRVCCAEGESVIPARRAAGCLLAPRPGDRVLVLLDGEDGEHFILNVLDRAQGPSVLDFEGDLEVRVQGGSARICSRGLDLEASERAAISSPLVCVEAASGTMRFGRLDLLARTLEARLEQVKSFCETVRLSASNVYEHVGRSIRAAGFVLRRATRMRIEVEGRYAVKADQASILAKDEMTVDAERINIG